MTSLTVSRKQRLRTLENRIRKNFESFVQTGMDLKEIRDDHLFKEDGFEKWDHYLKQRVGLEFGMEKRQAQTLIQCAEIRPKLPDLKSVQCAAHSEGWSQNAVLEFTRLVPDADDGNAKKDYSALRKADAARVAREAMKLAADGPLTSTHVRKAVDIELGIDRAKKAAATKREHENYEPTLADYIKSQAEVIEVVTKRLAEKVSADQWELLEESDPQLAERLATACDELAELLRS